jgi:hypothetical protein
MRVISTCARMYDIRRSTALRVDTYYVLLQLLCTDTAANNNVIVLQ